MTCCSTHLGSLLTCGEMLGDLGILAHGWRPWGRLGGPAPAPADYLVPVPASPPRNSSARLRCDRRQARCILARPLLSSLARPFTSLSLSHTHTFPPAPAAPATCCCPPVRRRHQGNSLPGKSSRGLLLLLHLHLFLHLHQHQHQPRHATHTVGHRRAPGLVVARGTLDGAPDVC